MKNILSLILVGSLVFLGSCKKFLQETPYSSVATSNFYKTPADAELAITGVYDVLNAPAIQGYGNQALWGRGMHFLTNLGCDDLTDNPGLVVAIPEFLALSNYTYTADNSNLWYAYFSLYAGINRANYIIEKVPTINMDTTRRKEIIGEAYFFRGMYHLYLTWLWGGVPVETSTVPDITSPRASIQQVMGQVESDLKTAYGMLKNRNTYAGRVNKYTAAGFLSKLYLYNASCKENSVGQSLNFLLNSFDWVNTDSCYKQALAYGADIYNNSGYKLIDSVNYLYLAATEATARDENMMIVQAGPNGNQEYIVFAYLSGPRGNYKTNSGPYGWLRPTKESYKLYNSVDGRTKCFSGYLNTTTVYTTIGSYKYYTPDAIMSNLANLCLNKWREDDPTNRTNRGIAVWGGETDFAILRYADALLMYAEAKYKTGDEAGARALLRQVRLRACANDAAKTNTLTTAYYNADFMTELLAERGRELVGEGWRRIDLIRFGKIKSVVANLDVAVMFNGEDQATVKSNFKDYKIWYPIPSRDIATNPNLIQNTGY